MNEGIFKFNSLNLVCKCPSGTSGIIYNSTDSRIIKLNMPSASATCGGCPSGYTQVN